MPPDDLNITAAKLRQQLAAQLAAGDSLRSPQWRTAVEDVPRHEFLRQFYTENLGPGVTSWTPISSELVGAAEWLTIAYSDQTLVTQFDGRPLDWNDPNPVSNANPTSSSTLPSLVVRMLEDLDVHDDMTVLELGTGTGYSTALLCHRLGDKNVTSIETDRDVADRARIALASCGYYPRLLTEDGRHGYAGPSPYDRTIATYGVRSVPAAWVKQTRPGGLIVTTLRGWMRSLGLVRLTVDGDGRAEGPFIAADPSFMIARQQAAPANMGMIPAPDDGKTRETTLGREALSMPDSGFVAQVVMPNARHFTMRDDSGIESTYVLDAENDSFAVLTQQGDDTWTVRQGGPSALWDDLEEAISLWHAADSPPPTGFGVSVTPDDQRVWLGSPDGPSWTLPK
ncbi:ATP-grasp peptide maturase system methyltransferase [Streptomyces sp. NPDC051909]|uniref:ATP-grasp peptide maturase system methyltransferase n=1 Tax=Streptomyces sp. NPDC051909 TaxID=3154944 RepID=UPI00342DA9C6